VHFFDARLPREEILQYRFCIGMLYADAHPHDRLATLVTSEHAHDGVADLHFVRVHLPNHLAGQRQSHFGLGKYPQSLRRRLECHLVKTRQELHRESRKAELKTGSRASCKLLERIVVVFEGPNNVPSQAMLRPATVVWQR
jgi:hypothetical protein